MSQRHVMTDHQRLADLNLSPVCPWTPPDWRSQRASWRVETGSRRGERQDDDWTRRAMRCLKELHREFLGHRPYRPEPDLRQAWQLAQYHDWRRAELEARILSNQPVGEISSAMGVSEGVISAFEALFFDVRPRLDARGWIIYQVIGLKPWGPLLPQDVIGAWKYLGFLHGPSTVDALVVGADLKDLEAIGLPAYWSPGSRLPKELQFVLLARSLPEYGKKALRSMSCIIELGLCQLSPYVTPPPTGLSLDVRAESQLDDILDCDASYSLADIPILRSDEFSRAA